MNRDEWKKYLRQTSEDIRLPESLEPEAIEKRLQKEESDDKQNPTVQVEDREKRRKVWYKSLPARAAAAAAVILLLAAVIESGAFRLSGGGTGASSAGSAAGETETSADTESASGADGQTLQKDSGQPEEAEESGGETGAKEIGTYFRTASYEEIEEMFREAGEKWEYDTGTGPVWNDTEESAEESAGSVESSAASDISADTASEAAVSAGAGGYSQTNTLVEGVDEGDVVKTDGTYIFVLKSGRNVEIYRTDQGEITEAGSIRPEDDSQEVSYQEMYVDGDRLVLAGNISSSSLEQESEDVYYMENYTGAVADTYDISDIGNPRHIGRTRQDGRYYTSRKVGDYLYLFSAYAVPAAQVFSADEESGFLPCTDGDRLIPEEDIYVPSAGLGDYWQQEYLLMTSVDLESPDEILDQKAVIDSGQNVSVTDGSIYLRNVNWSSGGETRTDIVRFSYENGEFQAVAGATLQGELTDEYALNEQDGYLRILLSGWDGSQQNNYVYVLDEDMNITGRIEGIAPGETIYSARFMGDIGYFVTYRNVDPLFTVDFSDPENPEIIGELKVTGFSDYLHFYGEDKLLGIGWETDAETGEQIGLKLSMFDISDPGSITELEKLVIKGIDFCPALNEYKGFLVDAGKNVIGFAAETYDDYGNSTADYLVFSYDSEAGFVQELQTGLPLEEMGYSTSDARGLYIADALYVVTQGGISSFDMKDGYGKIGEME